MLCVPSVFPCTLVSAYNNHRYSGNSVGLYLSGYSHGAIPKKSNKNAGMRSCTGVKTEAKLQRVVMGFMLMATARFLIDWNP